MLGAALTSDSLWSSLLSFLSEFQKSESTWLSLFRLSACQSHEYPPSKGTHLKNCFQVSLSVRYFHILKPSLLALKVEPRSEQRCPRNMNRRDKMCLVHTAHPSRMIVLLGAAYNRENSFQISLENCPWMVTDAHAEEMWIMLTYRLCDSFPPSHTL